MSVLFKKSDGRSGIVSRRQSREERRSAKKVAEKLKQERFRLLMLRAINRDSE